MQPRSLFLDLSGDSVLWYTLTVTVGTMGDVSQFNECNTNRCRYFITWPQWIKMMSFECHSLPIDQFHESHNASFSYIGVYILMHILKSTKFDSYFILFGPYNQGALGTDVCKLSVISRPWCAKKTFPVHEIWINNRYKMNSRLTSSHTSQMGWGYLISHVW